MFNGYFCKGTKLDPDFAALEESTCLAECTKSYTKDQNYWGNLKRCSSCSPGCKKCTSPNPLDCSSCLLGYTWNLQTSTCDKCFPTCLMCTGSRFNECTRCDEGYFWEKNSYNSIFLYFLHNNGRLGSLQEVSFELQDLLRPRGSLVCFNFEQYDYCQQRNNKSSICVVQYCM